MSMQDQNRLEYLTFYTMNGFCGVSIVENIVDSCCVIKCPVGLNFSITSLHCSGIVCMYES